MAALRRTSPEKLLDALHEVRRLGCGALSTSRFTPCLFFSSLLLQIVDPSLRSLAADVQLLGVTSPRPATTSPSSTRFTALVGDSLAHSPSLENAFRVVNLYFVR